MIFDQNPLTTQQHHLWKEMINNQFPEIIDEEIFPYSLIHAIESSPQRFYNKEIYRQYLLWMINSTRTDIDTFSETLREYSAEISHACSVLEEVNVRPIHENHLPSGDIDKIRFIEEEIIYSLLKLYEGPFYVFLKIIARQVRVISGKGTDGLDLYNVIQTIQTTELANVYQFYNNNLRNGIAHGKMMYRNNELLFIDKKGNEYSSFPIDLLRLFDKILDCCNAFALAFKAFTFSNPLYFETFKIPIPRYLLIEELKIKLKSPGWEVLYTYESQSINIPDQLNILVQNNFWSVIKVKLSCFQTAYLAETLTKTYGRIFISLKSKYSVDGWAAFDAKMIRELKSKDNVRLEEHVKTLQDNLVFFIPKFTFPKFVYTIKTYIDSVGINYKILKKKFRLFVKPKKFSVREIKFHAKRKYVVIEDASVILSSDLQTNPLTAIRQNKKLIIKSVIRQARKKAPLFSWEYLLPVRYIRVFIYDEDLRERSLRNSGLIPQIIATIQVNKSRRIQVPDIFRGNPEQIGKYRIVWFNGWRGLDNDTSG
jgi:hypothetical protein